MSAPVYGLVLAGGKSSRMQTDKAALSYRGAAQLTQAMRLVTPLVARFLRVPLWLPRAVSLSVDGKRPAEGVLPEERPPSNRQTLKNIPQL